MPSEHNQAVTSSQKRDYELLIPADDHTNIVAEFRIT
jgi:hypothetical protein